MSPRQRFLATLTFGTPDRVPFHPGGPMQSTVEAWRQQGMSATLDPMAAVCAAIGMEKPPDAEPLDLPVSFAMIPTFDEEILNRVEGHNIVRDWTGAIVEIHDRFDAAYHRTAADYVSRRWLKFPVESRDDWEKMKARYDPCSRGRFPHDFERRCQLLRGRDNPAGIHFNGPFWQLREWCGLERLCLLMVEDPTFVDEMAAFWAQFVSRTMAPVLTRMQLDSVGISEDMAFKQHSMISTEMVRRFVLPAYHQWVPQIKASGCPLVIMDCDGYVGDLIPLWIEAGVNCCWPVEKAADNDILAYREQHGRRMAYWGGVDKRVIAQGGDAMRAELTRIVPPLLEDGGFIPQCDHAVPPDVPWSHFVNYARLLAELTGWL